MPDAVGLSGVVNVRRRRLQTHEQEGEVEVAPETPRASR
jgi:hypothetical protein